MITAVEQLYRLPMDIEWGYNDKVLYMIQARPITTHTPLPEAMLTEPGADKRTLYYDCSVLEGILRQTGGSADGSGRHQRHCHPVAG